PDALRPQAPDALVVGGELRLARADLGMTPRLDVRRADGGILEVEARVDAAHERLRVGRVRETERVAELVREDLVEQGLARGLAASRRFVDDDPHGQGDRAVGADL